MNTRTSVGVRLLDRLREVDRLERLRGDRVRRGLARGLVRPVARVGVEADVRARCSRCPGRGSRATSFGERLERRAVHHHVQAEIDRSVPSERLDHPVAAGRVTSDDDVLVVMNDRHVHTWLVGDRRLHGRQRRRDPPVAPLRNLALGQSPERRRGPALTGELVDVHPRLLDLGDHVVEIVPDAERHQ